MEQLNFEFLKDYGLGGLVLFFCGWLVVTILRHFMAKDDRKDEYIKEISKDFTAALDRNTSAISSLGETEQELAAASKNIVSAFDRLTRETKEEHKEILSLIRNGGFNA